MQILILSVVRNSMNKAYGEYQITDEFNKNQPLCILTLAAKWELWEAASYWALRHPRVARSKTGFV